MRKSEYILSHIKNWDKASGDVLFTDLDRAFSMMYRMKLDEAEMLDAWKYVAPKSPFIAFSLLKRYKDNRYINNHEQIMEMIWQTANQVTEFNSKYIADILAMASLLKKDIGNELKRFLSESDDKKNICILACNNIEFLSDREKNILNLLKLLNKLIDAEYVEDALGYSRYQFSKYEVEPLVLEFVLVLLQEGSFVLAYLVKKMYAVDFKDVNISVDELYKSLRNCNNHNFFRGGIIYKDFLLIDDEIEKLKKWYFDLEKIKTEVAREELSGIKLICMCQAIQINPQKPEDVLREVRINISNTPYIEMNRKQYIREYRKTISELIKVKNIEWCKKFIELTQKYNIDKYECKDTTRWPISKDVREHIGLRDERELLQKIYDSDCNIESIVYVYMNSFLRGIVCFADFVKCIYKKYEWELISELQKYRIGGRISIDRERNIYYFQTNTVKKGRNKFFLTQEAASVLAGLEIEEKVSWFPCKIMSYNPQSEVFKFSVTGFGTQRLEKIIEQLLIFEYNGIISNELVEAVNTINISLLNDNTKGFVELCVRVLGAIVSCCDDKNKVHEAIIGLKRINYFAYYPTRNSGNERRLKGISIEQSKVIKRYWNQLYESKLDVMDCFDVYRNTILRRMYGLSQFIEKFVVDNGNSYSDFFSKVGEFAGRIQTYANSEETDDEMKLFVAPAEFKITNDAREKIGKKYDRYSLEIPLYGESSTSVRKKNNIRKSMSVRFEIDKYKGEGEFIIKNIKFL